MSPQELLDWLQKQKDEKGKNDFVGAARHFLPKFDLADPADSDCNILRSTVNKHGGGTPDLPENAQYIQDIKERLPEIEQKERAAREAIQKTFP